MKTDSLIAALAADAGGSPAPAMSRRIGAALAVAVPVSALLLLATIGVRPDIREAIATWRFDLKLVIVAAAALLSAIACARAARPQVASTRPLLALALGLLAAAVALELALTPAKDWIASLRGRNAALCLAAIPALSLAPLAALMLAMRGGAAAAPALAGAASGALAAALGAWLYALHCVDDSPLFVATWYTLASLPVIALGAVIGRRALRW